MPKKNKKSKNLKPDSKFIKKITHEMDQMHNQLFATEKQIEALLGPAHATSKILMRDFTILRGNISLFQQEIETLENQFQHFTHHAGKSWHESYNYKVLDNSCKRLKHRLHLSANRLDLFLTMNQQDEVVDIKNLSNTFKQSKNNSDIASTSPSTSSDTIQLNSSTALLQHQNQMMEKFEGTVVNLLHLGESMNAEVTKQNTDLDKTETNVVQSQRQIQRNALALQQASQRNRKTCYLWGWIIILIGIFVAILILL